MPTLTIYSDKPGGRQYLMTYSILLWKSLEEVQALPRVLEECTSSIRNNGNLVAHCLVISTYPQLFAHLEALACPAFDIKQLILKDSHQ